MPTVREILDLETLKMVFKSLNGDAPSYMSDIFTRVSETTSHVLHNSDIKIRTPMLKISTGQGCFSFRGASLWNGLQNKLKGVPTLRKFQEGLIRSRKVLNWMLYFYMNHQLFSFYVNFSLTVFINCKLFIKFSEYLNAWPPAKQFLFN